MGQKPWDYVDGIETRPRESKVEELKKWKKNNAKIMSSIISSVKPHIGINLCMYGSATAIWECLKNIYHQDNNVRKYNLAIETNGYT